MTSDGFLKINLVNTVIEPVIETPKCHVFGEKENP